MIVCTAPRCQTTAGCRCNELDLQAVAYWTGKTQHPDGWFRCSCGRQYKTPGGIEECLVTHHYPPQCFPR